MVHRRPFALGIYVLTVFAVSWPALIVGRLLVGAPVAHHAFSAPAMLMVPLGIPSLFHRQDAVCALNTVAMLTVALGTVLADRLFFRHGFAGAGWHRGRLWHYAAVFGLVLLIWLVPCVAAGFTGRVSVSSNLTPSSILWLFALLLAVALPAFAAEFGWRGYLLPNLLDRLSLRRAVLLHGVVWWAWYLPSTIGAAVYAGVAAGAEWKTPVTLSVATVTAVVLATLIPVVLHAVILAYIRLRSGSLAVATAYLAAFECVRDSVGTSKAFDPLVVGLWANGVICAIGLALLWKADWSTLARRSLPAGRELAQAPGQ